MFSKFFIIANKVNKIDNLGYYNQGCFYIYFNYSKRFGGGRIMSYYLAADIGASSGRHILGSVENGKINLEEIYRRDEIKPEHFANWVKWTKERALGLDFNPTIFSHPKAEDGLTLSHQNKEIRDFWIRHTIASRKIEEYFGRELGQTCLTNLWIPDGYKDISSDRLGPRARLKDSLEQIYAVKTDKNYNLDCVKSK